MGSPLIVSSEVFRKKIITKNLVPYIKSPSKITPPINYDTILSDYSVTDSPDVLIDEPGFAKNLYKNNQYGAEGGYKQVPDPTALLNSKSNEGEYGFQDAHIVDEGYAATQLWRPLNAYAASNNLDAADVIATLEILQVNNGRTPNGQTYPSFNSSSYSPVSILLSPDPIGSNGLLSQDSYIARLGAQLLKKEFEARIGKEIIRNTVGRANVFNVRGGTDVLSLLTGRVPLIEPNYTITVPANPLIAATDFALRLAGSTIPISTIPGSYFDPNINSGQPTTIQQLNNAFRKSTVGKFVTKLLGGTKTGSELFLNNTGGGQKSRLFGNLNYNKYKPGYDRTIFDRLGGAIVGTNTQNSNYYIGSTSSEPSRVFSPSGVLPVNSFGEEQQSPVYGPSELAQLYEGPSKEIKLGANGVAYVNGGGIEGGLTWISPGTESNAGKRVGLGGKVTASEGVQVQPSFGSTISSDKTFKDGSILYQTQKIIDAAGKSGGKKLQHVGNAIDQVSKVFNDGYKEITKGSKVIKYTGNIGQEVGVEYCRVFTKDLPYLQYNDLQKADGITTQNRKIGYSVLDSTYNLNIYPNKKTGTANSTNLVGDPDKDGHVKKYMFSLENLAWRTSSKPGYTYSDLPVCERGPNGGRIMWFPPYGLTFSENNSASWKDSSFIGRPEPIYTYSNTNRTGSLSWKIVVDHPSVLNMIVNKVLNNETNKERINSMVDSFFAGCLKYDLYELAKKYPLANPNDLYVIQTELDSKQVTKEQVTWIKKDIQSGVDSSTSNTTPQAQNPQVDTQGIVDGLLNLGFYFYNDVPGKTETTPQSYNYYYDSYVDNKQTYIDAATKEGPANNSQMVSSFFTDVIEWNFTSINENLNKIYSAVKANQYEKIVINLVGTTSAPASQAYNLQLSKRRDDSAKKYIRDFKPVTEESTLSELAQTNNIILSITQKEEGETSVTTRRKTNASESYKCSDQDSKSQSSKDINTVNAMACRRVAIQNVQIVPRIEPVPTNPPPVVNTTTQYAQQITNTTTTVTTETQRPKLADNISKRVLRLLLSECDYFESIKEDTPMVYDNLKDKLKFFNPAFHSTTPEGLNSRLTFLNQCLRPGETIPVVKTLNGKATLQYNNAVNTAFGSPPVLVLRVGDFYNTKIIPDSLNITYENLDINPEGIGIQPMIANITMNFKFIGGSGIKDAVDRIQNALSFNYYANTEIYDDRAEVTDTESLKKMDEDFAAMYSNIPQPTLAQVQNNNGQNNGSFIGEVLSTIQSESGTTGEISYTKLVSQISDGTQNYFQTIFNKNKEVLSQYNEGVRQMWTLNRNYTEGVFTPGSSQFEYLFGKSSQFQQNIGTVFETYQQEISGDVDLFISAISAPNKNFSPKVIREVKQNYANFISTKSDTFENALTKIIQESTIAQQTYIQQIAKLIVITYGDTVVDVPISGTDGYQEKNGYVQVYYTTSSGGTLENLLEDKLTIRASLYDYYLKLGEEINFTAGSGKQLKNKIMLPNNQIFSQSAQFVSVSQNPKFDDINFKNQYIVLNQDIIDDKTYDAFKEKIIGSILANPSLFDNGNPKLSEEFDAYWKLGAAPAFKEENSAALDFLNYMERTELKNFLNYTAIDKTKERKVSYSNIPDTTEDGYNTNRQNYIKSLGLKDNSTTNPKTFNDSIGGIYITKVKLN